MKTTIGRLIAAGAFLATMTTSAHAGKVLWTAPALAAYPTTQTINCEIVNVGPTPQTATIDALDYFGNVINTAGPVLLAPEGATTLADGTGQAARCRFTVSGSTKKVKAQAVYSAGTAYNVAIPAF